MPACIRSNKKATKIAYDIIGKPANMVKTNRKSIQEREAVRIQYQDDKLQK